MIEPVECRTNCPIADGGICPRHNVWKSAHWTELCRTRDGYFEAWEKGAGPGQRPTESTRKRFRGGPGTELHRLLAKCGYHETPGCRCRSRRFAMNRWGPDKCREKMDTILGWMAEEAEIRKVRFNRTLAKLAVLRAIRVARKKQRAFERMQALENAETQ